jgi:hypothetical protein
VGQYGAWGNYVDGCTAKLQCAYARCYVVASGILRSYEESWWPYDSTYRQTCNARLRVFWPNGVLKRHQDASGDTNSGDSTYGWQCWTGSMQTTVLRGESVTVQANGVRAPLPGSARIEAGLNLSWFL